MPEETALARENRTVARSFRVSQKALRALEEEASRQNTSVNTLENQILHQYAEYTRFARRLRNLQIPRTTLEQILNLCSDEELAPLARKMGRSVPPAYMTSKWGEVNPNAVLGLVHDYSAHANWFEYNETRESGKLTLTLFHELGHKWTLWVSNYFGEVFGLAGLHPEMTSTDNSVTFTFSSSQIAT